MEKKLTQNKECFQLISDLKKLLEEGKKQAQISVNQIVVETYWKMSAKFAKQFWRDLAKISNMNRFEILCITPMF